jgi:2-oxoglutarate ferredoxin oxidoreductase subunit beta
MATGAMFADLSLKAIGVSGDGDTTNIGMGQFKHIMRRNIPMVYIIENNGVYGLTKGQFSATAEFGLQLKNQGTNMYMPVDVVMEALASNATFVARSFAGDSKQVKSILKAALSHDGLAVVDIISPCVTFNNHHSARHSYEWNIAHDERLHDFSFIPMEEEITLEDVPGGSTHSVTMHDGSKMVFRKLERDYDPTDRCAAMRFVEDCNKEEVLLTGLIYVDTFRPTIKELFKLPDKALNRMTQDELRPPRETIDRVNAMMF